MFAFRLKVPKDYFIAPHTHPKPEIVTVISGTAGSFFALTPGSAHYFYADENTVIQLNSTGPWSIDYVDVKDDPRKK